MTYLLGGQCGIKDEEQRQLADHRDRWDLHQLINDKEDGEDAQEQG